VTPLGRRVAQLIDDYQERHPDYSATFLADLVVKDLRDNHKKLLAMWQDELADQHIRIAVLARRSSRRNTARRTAGKALAKYSSVFADPHATKEEKAKAKQTLDNLRLLDAISPPVNSHGETRQYGKMTKADNLYVSESYAKSGQGDLLKSQFFATVAARLDDHTVEEVFTPAQYAQLMESVLGAYMA
jgi:hypothetical protein